MEHKSLPVAPYGTNCYFLCDKDAGVCAVIDPGGNPEQIGKVLDQLGCKPCVIFLTHGHYDHTGAVADLLARYPGTPVYIHRGDYEGVDTHMFPLSTQVPPEAVTFYDEGDTAGHSEGSVTLRCGSALFCGDTLFAGSCGRTDFAGGSVEKIMASLKRLGQLEGDLDVLPGHMDTSTLDRERKSNPYLRQALRT